jgi:hypothetical protein
LREIHGFGGSLYLGHGDASADTGPTDVLLYDGSRFTLEFTCDDEMISRYRELGGKLAIPGADAVEDWSFGNLYVREPSGWVKLRTIPNAVHVLDLCEFRGLWYAAVALKTDSPASVGAVFVSSDSGRSWTLSHSIPPSPSHHTRVGTLVVHDDTLYAFAYSYASDRYIPDPSGPSDSLLFDGRSWTSRDLIPRPELALVRSAHSFKGRLLIHALFGQNVLFGRRGEPRHYLLQVGLDAPLIQGPILDVESCSGRLYVLQEKSISHTEDLSSWRTLSSPPDPESIWADSSSIYVGTRAGELFKRRID